MRASSLEIYSSSIRLPQVSLDPSPGPLLRCSQRESSLYRCTRSESIPFVLGSHCQFFKHIFCKTKFCLVMDCAPKPPHPQYHSVEPSRARSIKKFSLIIKGEKLEKEFRIQEVLKEGLWALIPQKYQNRPNPEPQGLCGPRISLPGTRPVLSGQEFSSLVKIREKDGSPLSFRLLLSVFGPSVICEKKILFPVINPANSPYHLHIFNRRQTSVYLNIYSWNTWNQLPKIYSGDFPGGPVVEICLPMQRGMSSILVSAGTKVPTCLRQLSPHPKRIPHISWKDPVCCS